MQLDGGGQSVRILRIDSSEVVELDREIGGSIGNRFQCAALREVPFIMSQGVTDLEAIDRTIAAGPATQWAAMGVSSSLYLGKSDLSQWKKLVESIGRAPEGYTAPANFNPHGELLQAYAEQASKGIGANGQAGLMALRNAGVVSIRSALERVRASLTRAKHELD